jgi:hypothetical protein
MTKYINQEVEVNAFYFSQGRGFRSFPQAVTLGNRRYTFKDGLQMLIQRGDRVTRLFDMSDGDTTYRLKNENDSWTLVGMTTA